MSQHDCNYCGQSYCGSCTVKVKRAVLGATCESGGEGDTTHYYPVGAWGTTHYYPVQVPVSIII